MKLEGSRMIAADRAAVWEKLNDPEVLRRCIPGCQTLEQLSPTELKATVGLKIGPMNAKFSGDVKLTDLDPPNSYRIEGSGSGGVAGRASGGADVRLEAVEEGTELKYDVDANVSGKIAQLGQRLISATANQLADRFFSNFQNEFPAIDAPAGQTGAAVDNSANESETSNATAAGAAAAAQAQVAPRPAAQADSHAPMQAQARSPASSRSSRNPWVWYGAGALALALLTFLIVQSF